LEDADFSDEFCRFVQATLPTVDAAELLVGAFRNPASDALARHVATLAQAWEERPVTLVRLICALRDHKIRSFAEVFKLRKN
jgi:hypothetical protein